MTRCTTVMALLVAFGLPVRAADPCRSGLEPGKRPGPYAFLVSVGPQRGKSHCFICETEDRPAVIVFARTMNEPLGKLLRGLDKALVDHRSADLRGWVTFLSEDQPRLDPQLAEWARKLSLGVLPVGVFEDSKGPPTYRLSDEAELTILLSVKQKVVANYAFRPGELDEKGIREVLAALAKILPGK